MPFARGVIEALAKDRATVAALESSEGDDEGPYVNFTFQAKDVSRLWAKIQRKVLEHARVGAALAKSSIIICEGSEGWDNYLLLHHFDRRLKLDTPDET
jgi:hypothetical protein